MLGAITLDGVLRRWPPSAADFGATFFARLAARTNFIWCVAHAPPRPRAPLTCRAQGQGEGHRLRPRNDDARARRGAVARRVRALVRPPPEPRRCQGAQRRATCTYVPSCRSRWRRTRGPRGPRGTSRISSLRRWTFLRRPSCWRLCAMQFGQPAADSTAGSYFKGSHSTFRYSFYIPSKRLSQVDRRGSHSAATL